jgi:DNA-binding CsgD family transcriptional regulator
VKTEYYNDCLAPLDLHYHLFGLLASERGVQTAITLVRPQRVGDFTADERALSERLVPHLQRVIRMNHHLQTVALQQQAMLRGLDGLAVGVILAAGDGRVLFANRVAEAALGRGLDAPQQRLRAMTPALTQALHRRIREAADTGAGAGQKAGGALSLPCRSGGTVSLLICPFPIAAGSVVGPTVPAALIFMGGSEGTTVRPSDLRQIYGLTGAEAKLAGALLAGTKLRDYAAVSGISIETAKTQLRQVFAKTGQRRQADLIRHILSNPVVQLAPRELPPER